MSNELTRLVEKIQYLTGMSKDEVAKSIDYSRQHLSREMKTGNIDIENMLKEKFKDKLHNGTLVEEIRQPDIIVETLRDLARSNVILAEANKKLADAHDKLVDKTVPNSVAQDPGYTPVVPDLYLLRLASVLDGKDGLNARDWHEELNRLLIEKLAAGKVRGTPG